MAEENKEKTEEKEVGLLATVETTQDQSVAFGVSMRGWLTFLLTLTVCGIAVFEPDTRKILEFGFSTAIGYYFGQKNK